MQNNIFELFLETGAKVIEKPKKKVRKNLFKNDELEIFDLSDDVLSSILKDESLELIINKTIILETKTKELRK